MATRRGISTRPAWRGSGEGRGLDCPGASALRYFGEVTSRSTVSVVVLPRRGFAGWFFASLLLLAPRLAWAAWSNPTMTASPAATAAASSQITVSVTSNHTGGKDDNSTLAITLPSGWTCVSVAVAGNGSLTAAPACSNSTVTWNAGSQAGSKTLTLSVTAQSPASVVNGNTVTFTGSIDSDQIAPKTTTLVVTYRATLVISGRVFEDINYPGGAGREYATANLLPSALSPIVPITVQSARVELYNSAGTFVSATTTNASGVYAFTSLSANTTYNVRVVNSTVLATRTGATSAHLGVQTYRLGTNGTNEVGGASPAKVDAGNGSTTLAALATATTAAQSVATVALVNSDVSNADFGFSFNTVVNTNDSGQGSLRQVLTNMNALASTNLDLAFQAPFEPASITGTDVTLFMIPNGAGANGIPAGVDLFGAAQADGARVATLNLLSALPAPAAGTYVDATTHPAWSTRPIIELNGTGAGAATVGVVNAGTLRGFIINRFTSHGSTAASGCTACVWEGNWFGLNAAGSAAAANGGSGLSLTAGSGHVVGMATASNAKYRNVISGNTGSGISMSVATSVKGNFIGTNASGTAAVANGADGITVTGGAATLIPSGSFGNVVSGNTAWGVRLTNVATTGTAALSGANIGVGNDGTTAIANGSGGVRVVSVASGTFSITANNIGSNNGPGIQVDAGATSIGDGTATGGNTLFNNTGAGVVVVTNTSRITRNSIYGNGGRGIDLAPGGVTGTTANDGAKSASPNPNLLMDTPVFTSAGLSGTSLTVTGYVGSAASQSTFGSAVVELFKSDTTTGGNYQGRTYLGAITAAANGSFNNTASPLTVGGLTVGDVLVATARDTNGNTSEFSASPFTVTGPGPNHLGFSHGGTGVTCTPTAVTLTAHNSDHTTFTSYLGTVTLSTSTAHGDWALAAGNGTLNNGTAGDGTATYTFVAADNGTVTFNYSNTFAETVNLNATDGTASDTSGTPGAGEDASIVFSTSGFAFQAGGVVNAIGTQIAGKSSGVAPGAQALTLRAIKTSDSSTVCVPALQGTKTVQFAYECISPATCSAATLSLSGGSATTIAGNPAGSVAGYTNTTITFDNAGTAPFSFTWNDAGSAKLYARYALPLTDGNASGNFMSGASNAFVSRPLGFEVSISGNPAATTGTGTQFTSAGTPFNGTARAVAWSAAADGNNDGIADGMESTDTNAANNVNLGGNATTPNFTPGTSLTLSSNLVSPNPGTHPGLSGTPTATFSNGVASISGLRYDEVGIIEISAAQSGDYLGIGSAETARIRGTSGHVGRFVPKRFSVTANTPTFANSCAAGSFTYEGQPFYYGTAPVLSVTAVSAQGGATQNYTRSGYFKLVSTLSGRTFANAAAGTHPVTVANTGSPTIAGDTGGTGTATFTLPSGISGDAFTYTKGNPGAPFTSSVNASFTVADLTDGDGVCHDATNDGTCDTFSISGITGASLRYGQLVIENAMGPETAALAVPLYTQYYNGSGWLLNAADACTTLSTAALDFGAGTPAGTPAAGVASFAIGSATSTASLTRATASGGLLGLSLSAPGSGNTGEITYLVNLSTAAAAWLQGDWNNDGTRTDNPSGRATFGIFQGPKKVIFRREVW